MANRKRKTRARVTTPAVLPGEFQSNEGIEQFERAIKRIGRAGRHNCFANEPRYEKDTRELDCWVYECVRQSQFLEGFIDQAAMVHSNRPYSVTGPRRALGRFLDVLHSSAGGGGFRELTKIAAQQYYMSNFGSAVHVHRATPPKPTFGRNEMVTWQLSPAIALTNLDSTRMAPSYYADERMRIQYPYRYNGEDISEYDILRLTSMPDWRLETFGNGHSAAYRCCTVIKITKAIYDYLNGVLDPSTVKGIVTVSGYDESSFSRAAKEAEETAAAKGGSSPDDILMLFNPEGDIKIRYELLQRMPESMSLTEWLRWGLTEIAVQLGFPLEEFIGSQASTFLGQSGNEVQAGERRANSKGAGEFTKLYHEKMTRTVIPESLEMRFFERDAEATKQEWEIKKLQTDIILRWYEAAGREVKEKTDSQGNPTIVVTDEVFDSQIINAGEARRWGVEAGVLPEWFSDDEEQITVKDDEEANLRHWQEQAKDNRRIARGASLIPTEPIVRYESEAREGLAPDGTKQIVDVETFTVLFESGHEMLKRSVWGGIEIEEQETVVAHPFPVKRNTIEQALDSSEAEDFLEFWREALTAQYTDATTGDDAGDIPPLTDSIDNERMVAFILGFAAMGIALAQTQAGQTLSAEVLVEINATIQAWVDDRVAALLEGLPDDFTIEDLRYYPLPDNILDVQSAVDIAALLDLTDEELEDLTTDRIDARAATIATIEAIIAHSFGQYIAGRNLGAISKRWLPSTAANPREIHIAQYGAVVPLEDNFPDGSFWSNELYNCQCGIELIFA